MLYRCNDIIIEHNEISDSNSGIFIKGEVGGPITVRYNYLHNIDLEGITVGEVGTATEQYGARIYQNIIRDNMFGITLIGLNSTSPANVDIVNNTIYNNSRGGIYIKPNTSNYRDIVISNNIIANNGSGVNGEDVTNVGDTTFTHNLYYNNDSSARIRYTNYSFSSWQNNFQKDTVGSRVVDPLFSSTSANTLTLSSNSPANDSGVDILNLQNRGVNSTITLGAKVTGNEVIGVTDGLALPASTPSSAPPSRATLY
jgi:hypothetical protein